MGLTPAAQQMQLRGLQEYPGLPGLKLQVRHKWGPDGSVKTYHRGFCIWRLHLHARTFSCCAAVLGALVLPLLYRSFKAWHTCLVSLLCISNLSKYRSGSLLHGNTRCHWLARASSAMVSYTSSASSSLRPAVYSVLRTEHRLCRSDDLAVPFSQSYACTPCKVSMTALSSTSMST